MGEITIVLSWDWYVSQMWVAALVLFSAWANEEPLASNWFFGAVLIVVWPLLAFTVLMLALSRIRY